MNEYSKSIIMTLHVGNVACIVVVMGIWSINIDTYQYFWILEVLIRKRKYGEKKYNEKVITLPFVPRCHHFSSH